MNLLAGDVGGTKTNLAVYSDQQGPRAPLAEATFPSARYTSLEAVVRDFLSQVHLQVDRASFGVAGPVVDGKARITNLPWLMDESHLAEELNLTWVRLLNDLEAIAHAVPFLEGQDLVTINEGQRYPHGNIAVIAPGTGLGEAFLTWDGSNYHAHASEGGHAGFAPSNPLELDLLRYLLRHYDHVSCERVCSGLGLPNIYHFLRDSGYAQEPAWLGDRLANAADHTPVIVQAALDVVEHAELAVATLNTFVSILGSEAGNLALKVLATGGVFLGGGIPPRIIPSLTGGLFMDAFRRKGRFTRLLDAAPVQVILNPKSALFGAACHGLETVPD